MARISHLIAGPHRHGVVRFGLELHDELRRNGCAVSLCRPDPPGAPLPLTGQDGLHVQFTDRLFGIRPHDAAETFAAVADGARSRGIRVTATVHDVPQTSDGAQYGARAAAYGRVAALCDAVVVSSGHERELLRENRIDVENVSVIPLPLQSCGHRPRPDPPTGIRSLGVFGFLYPGKGHEEVIAAAAGLPADVAVVAIGEPSAGHDDLVTHLRALAARHGRRFDVTGHVDDTELTKALRQVTVPIAAHRHISASGSLNAWLAAGRRPLAPANRYTVEIERRNPGTIALYDDTTAGLHGAVVAALERPETTWLAADTVLRPSPRQAAADYADFFEGRTA